MSRTKSLRPGWRLVRLGEVVRDVRNSTQDPAADGIERVVGLEHLDTESLPLRRWDELAELPDGTSFTRIFRAGQVLFGKRRAYQRKVAVPDFDGICSSDILVLEPTSTDLLREFLPYIVQSNGFFDQALGTSAGSLSPRTKWQDLAKYEFALPPLDQQERFVDVLAACDGTIDRHVNAEHNAEALLVALRAEAFRSSAEVRPLGQTLDCLIDHRGKTPRKLGADFVDNGVPVISAMHVTAAGIELSESRFVETEVWRRWMPEPLVMGDILLTSEAPLGRTAVVDSEVPLCLGQRLFALRPNPEAYRPRFLQLLLDSVPGQQLLRSHATGSTVRGIRAAALKQIRLPVPQVQMQDRFCASAEAIQVTSMALTSCLTSLRLLRQELLAEFLGANA